MKRLLLPLLTLPLFTLLFCTPIPAASPTFVRNGVNVTTSSGTTSAIASQTTTISNLGIVICAGGVTTGTISVADGGTDTFVAIGSVTNSTTEGSDAQMFYVQSLAGGTKTITCTWSASSVFRTIWYYELSGQAGSALDVSGNKSSDVGGNSATPTVTLSGTATDTTTVSGMFCGATCSVGSCTPNTCTNGLSDGSGDQAEMQANSSGGSTAMVFSQTNNAYVGVAASFKGAGGAATCNNQIMLMGVGCK